MTTALFAIVGVLVAVLAYYVGVGVGVRRGIKGAMEMLSVALDDSAGRDARVDGYLREFGGRIDAGRRGDN